MTEFLKNQINTRIKEVYGNIIHLQDVEAPFSYDGKRYLYKDSKSKSLDNIIKCYMKNEKHKFVYELFGYFNEEDKMVSIPFSLSEQITLPDASTDSHSNYKENLFFEDYTLISSIDHLNVSILICEEDVSDICRFKINLDGLSHFETLANVSGSFYYHPDIEGWDIIEYSKRYITCQVYGLKLKDNIPIWVEYLFSSFIFNEIGNKKMAILNAFSALEHYTELLYTSTLEIYKKFSENPNYNVSEETMSYLTEKIHYYSNNERRLIEQKLKPCLKEIKEDISNYSNILITFYKYTDYRNQIAHCRTDSSMDIDFDEFIYAILVIICYTNSEANIKDFITFE